MLNISFEKIGRHNMGVRIDSSRDVFGHLLEFGRRLLVLLFFHEDGDSSLVDDAVVGPALHFDEFVVGGIFCHHSLLIPDVKLE